MCVRLSIYKHYALYMGKPYLWFLFVFSIHFVIEFLTICKFIFILSYFIESCSSSKEIL